MIWSIAIGHGDNIVNSTATSPVAVTGRCGNNDRGCGHKQRHAGLQRRLHGLQQGEGRDDRRGQIRCRNVDKPMATVSRAVDE